MQQQSVATITVFFFMQVSVLLWPLVSCSLCALFRTRSPRSVSQSTHSDAVKTLTSATDSEHFWGLPLTFSQDIRWQRGAGSSVGKLHPAVCCVNRSCSPVFLGAQTVWSFASAPPVRCGLWRYLLTFLTPQSLCFQGECGRFAVILPKQGLSAAIVITDYHLQFPLLLQLSALWSVCLFKASPNECIFH